MSRAESTPRPGPQRSNHPNGSTALPLESESRGAPIPPGSPHAQGPGPRPRLLHEVFRAQARSSPSAIAVQWGDRATTYADLERLAHRFARHLRGRGVTRGARVGLMLPRSPEAYAAMLGVLEAGAAYVPLDPECPADRAAFILHDSGASALVTDASLATRHGGFGGSVVCADADAGAIAAEPDAPVAADEAGTRPDDLAYIIYTSGSTGRPKGVMIEHRSVVHFVECEAALLRVHPGDRVYQGFTLAFDASVEEVWLAFRSGATLVPATPDMEQAGPDLSRRLAAARVTVLSCVPTLLSMLEDDVPSLRLVILGGEACPEQLVARWSRHGRRLVNTYGPTETTVIATLGDLRRGHPVTLGRPIPGYRVHVLGGDLEPVPRGELGEIFIGGIGVARGYVNLPREQRERFVPAPPSLAGTAGTRLYRTGDLGRVTGNGEIEFAGRADTQVKLRGFRIELAEIESALLGCDGVRSAACALREDHPGLPQLVGYVVSNNGPVDESRLRSLLRRRLPAYMVPSLIEPLADLPRLPSGKLDRAALPPPAPRENVPRPPARRARTDTERAIARVWECLFHPQPVSRDDDFFLDLGGHSLLAARAVSQLRADPRFARVSMADLYRNPSIATLAAAVDAAGTGFRMASDGGRPRADGGESTARLASPPGACAADEAPEARRHALAGAMQAAGLYFVFGWRALEWVTPYLLFWRLLDTGVPVAAATGWAIAAAVAVPPCLAAVAIAAKWALLGRIRPGRHRLWGAFHLRWWFAHSLIEALPVERLSGTPLLPLVYRLLGARVGRDVYLGTDDLAAYDVISIGDGSSVDDDASLPGCSVEDGTLCIGPVTIGRDCFVGARAVLREDTVLEDGSRIEDLSLLPRGGRIPARETWTGSPAARADGAARPAWPPARGPVRRAATLALYAALVLVLPLVPLAAIVPGMVALVRMDLLARPLAFLAAAPLVGASFVLLMTAEVTCLKWVLAGRVRAGSHRLDGVRYVRVWIVDQLMAMSLDVIAPIYATLWVAPWYRALGARIGRRVELSTAASTPPDLLQIDESGTIADEASIGEPRIERGWMTVAPARVGRRAFVGNSGVLPTGSRLGDGALVGVLSTAPAGSAESARAGVAWLGSPPIALPNREVHPGFREDRTYDPPTWLVAARAAFELLRVTLPPSGFVLVTAAVVSVTLRLWRDFGAGAALLLAPLVYAGSCAFVLLAVALAKWLIIGRYRPFVRPLWSPFVWRLELVNALYEFLATPLALDALRGTPLLPGYLRLLGSRIGRRTHLDTTGFLEWDLVDIGDRAALGADCVAQTHLFEDRVLKASRLRIGSDCTVGALSVVLYDADMEDGSSLDALSLLMKGETLPRHTAWAGIPAEPAGPTRAEPRHASAA